MDRRNDRGRRAVELADKEAFRIGRGETGVVYKAQDSSLRPPPSSRLSRFHHAALSGRAGRLSRAILQMGS
jgi:hypothetical protein